MEPGEDNAGGQAEAKGQDAADDDDQAGVSAGGPSGGVDGGGAGGREAETLRPPEGWEFNDAW